MFVLCAWYVTFGSKAATYEYSKGKSSESWGDADCDISPRNTSTSDIAVTEGHGGKVA